MALWARAYYLQIVMGPEYADRARRQHTAREVVAGVRGNIMDRNGNILAKSVDCRSAWVNPALVQDKQATAVKLAQALNEPPGRILGLLNEKKQFVWVARKLDYHAAEKIKALNLPGVSLEPEFERVYPYKHLAGQLLGFVNIDDKGLEGLEKSFDDKLAGRKVTQLVERDAAGRRMMTREAGDISELRGQDVRLSIDLQVQFFAEEALAESVSKFGAKWGGCIVVDLYVRPECRRRGIGRALMAALAAETRRQGAVCLWWGVDEGDDEATAFYISIGAVLEERFEGRLLADAAYHALAAEAEA